ncbi:MAG: hypothetical protein JWR10_340 [Rubritepida sp.]|nr:hypothetical protein [Rubritepida sp.]
MSDPIARAFPTRPLTIKAPLVRWRAWLVALVGIPLFVGGGLVASYEILPVLISDREIREIAVPLPKVRVENGHCRSRLMLLQSCDVTLVVPQVGGGTLSRKVGYLFLQPGGGDRQVTPMGDPARPELASIDLGLERWVNRVITYVCMMALLVVMVIGTLIVPISAHGRRKVAAAMSGRVLHPEPARIAYAQRVWHVTPMAGGLASKWEFSRRKAAPFVVDPRGGIILAVTAPGAPLFPLDEDLTWIDFTEQERAALRAARDEVIRGAPPQR